jgi:hypothetical protein
MFLMYARLYFLLFRAHRRLLSLGNSSSTGYPSAGGSGAGHNGSGSGSAQHTTNGTTGGNNGSGSGSGSGYAGPAVPARHTRKLKRVRPNPLPRSAYLSTPY